MDFTAQVMNHTIFFMSFPRLRTIQVELMAEAKDIMNVKPGFQ